jgi:hypothetical protein
MNSRLTTRATSLDARANALASRKQRLVSEIDAEMMRPAPCHLQLGKLKRSKLRLKDEIAEIEGVLSNVQRARLERRAS